MLTNVINVSSMLKEVNLSDQKKRGDESEDCPGLVQDSWFHDGLHALLFEKEGLKVMLGCLPCWCKLCVVLVKIHHALMICQHPFLSI